jgi:DNA replication protein DnaC
MACYWCNDEGVTAINPGGRFKPMGAWYACDCPAGAAALDRHAKHSATGVFLATVPERYRAWTFDTFPALSSDAKERAGRVKAWANEAEHPGKPWLLLYGPTGRGKTGLAISAARAIVDRLGLVGRYVSMVNEFDEIKGTFDQGTYAEYVKSLIGTPVLVVDEFAVGAMTPWQLDQIFKMIHKRHARNLITIWATDRGHMLGDLLPEAAYRRILDASYKVQLTGVEIDSKEGMYAA